MVDVTGGDLGLATDLLSRVPEEETLDEEALQAACETVIRTSECARQIRNFASELEDRDLLVRLLAGPPITGAPPINLESSPLKELYLNGLADYDPMLRAYRPRAPLVAEIAMRALGLESSLFGALREHVHSRTAYLIWLVAQVEISLRASFEGQDCRELAKKTKTSTEWTGVGAAVKNELLKRCPEAKKVIKPLNDVLKEIVPDQQTVLDAIGRRGHATSGDSGSDLLGATTYREMVGMLSVAGLIEETERHALENIGSVRNDVAHFRPISFEKMLGAVRDAAAVLGKLVGRKSSS